MIGSKTRVYYEMREALTDPSVRYIDNEGGTRSGKTFSTIELLVEIAKGNPNLLISIVSETFPHLKRGAIRDFQAIMADEWVDTSWNKTESIYYFDSGSLIEFFSADQPGKVHGPARDILFANESNHIPWDTIRQLMVRTRLFCIFDYNPTHQFWIHEHIKIRPNCRSIHSTYKDNPYLTGEQIREIESNRGDKNWWRVYGEGKVGTLEGLIYEFDLVDSLPALSGKLVEVWGMDFGFSCFTGDTLVMTDKGEIPIKDVKAGDLVLTRQGYRQVIENKYNGVKEVCEKICKFENGDSIKISATYNHNFNVNGKWKKYGKLEEGDRLCILSSSMALSTGDTQRANIQTIISTSGGKAGRITKKGCIMQYGRRPTASLSPKGMTSTTRISTRSTMTPQIYNSLPKGNTPKSTNSSPNTTMSTPNIVNGYRIPKRIGASAGKLRWNVCKVLRESAKGAGRSTSPQTFIKGSARNIVITGGNTQAPIAILTLFANTAGKRLEGISTLNRNHAALNVRQSCLLSAEVISVRREPVFDLWVDGVHEYFANGILVHNCDPTAIVKVIADPRKREAWVQEMCYETGMLNRHIVERFRSIGIDPRSPIYADCAEPKSIAEIKESGFNILPCVKDAPVRSEKLKFQIQWVQGWTIHVTKDSLNLIKESRNYVWEKDKDGNVTNTPIDVYNHALDALRYGLYTRFGQNAGYGQYRISIR